MLRAGAGPDQTTITAKALADQTVIAAVVSERTTTTADELAQETAQKARRLAQKVQDLTSVLEELRKRREVELLTMLRSSLNSFRRDMLALYLVMMLLVVISIIR